MRSPWHTQLVATVDRNMSIKLSDWRNTCKRVVLPVCFTSLSIESIKLSQLARDSILDSSVADLHHHAARGRQSRNTVSFLSRCELEFIVRNSVLLDRDSEEIAPRLELSENACWYICCRTFSLSGTAWRSKVDGLCQPVDQPPYMHGACAYTQWRADENLVSNISRLEKPSFIIEHITIFLLNHVPHISFLECSLPLLLRRIKVFKA